MDEIMVVVVTATTRCRRDTFKSHVVVVVDNAWTRTRR